MTIQKTAILVFAFAVNASVLANANPSAPQNNATILAAEYAYAYAYNLIHVGGTTPDPVTQSQVSGIGLLALDLSKLSVDMYSQNVRIIEQNDQILKLLNKK